jgi:hypothetical protein
MSTPGSTAPAQHQHRKALACPSGGQATDPYLTLRQTLATHRLSVKCDRTLSLSCQTDDAKRGEGTHD